MVGGVVSTGSSASITAPAPKASSAAASTVDASWISPSSPGSMPVQRATYPVRVLYPEENVIAEPSTLA